MQLHSHAHCMPFSTLSRGTSTCGILPSHIYASDPCFSLAACICVYLSNYALRIVLLSCMTVLIYLWHRRLQYIGWTAIRTSKIYHHGVGHTREADKMR